MAKLITETVKVLDVQPHPNADRLDIATVKGWNCIVGKDSIKVGDIVIYITPDDSVLPEKLMKILFSNTKINPPKKGRIKTIKIRGAISQGLIITYDQLVNHYPGIENYFSDGCKVDKFLGIKKYEPKQKAPFRVRGEHASKKQINPNFKRYSSLNHFKNFPNAFEDDERIVITEKIHGCLEYNVIIETLEFGPLPIGKIVDEKIKCHVKSFDINNNEICFKYIENHSSQENIENWYEIEINNGKKLKVTGNHLIWLPKYKCYRRVDQLKPSDFILMD